MGRPAMKPRRKMLPLHAECWRDRHGKLRTYFRKGNVRLALPPWGSPEFWPAYHAALTGTPLNAAASAPVPPQSIGALVESYIASSEYRALRATTKAGYSFQLDTLRREHGHRSVAGLTRENIKKLLAPFADKPGAALSRLN